MKLTALTPMMNCKDVAATVAFYTGVLGFTCTSEQPGYWAHLQLNGIELMIAAENEHLPFEKALFTGSFYFRTNDVEAWWSKLKDGPEVVYALETFDYGMREFAIRDINGYILQFGQEVH